MENTSENIEKNAEMQTAGHLCVGLVAHVDAGKTTLAEGILYTTGQIRRLGRVDHRDAFLDTDQMEKDRGITIFSKQAETVIGDKKVALLDTPGHVDFSAEMERTLQGTMRSLSSAGRTASRDMWRHCGICWRDITSRSFCLSTRWTRRGQMRKSSWRS